MIITKKHKLYFRDSKGVIKRLDKVTRGIYFEIISVFQNETYVKKYARLNRKAKYHDNYKPIPLILSEERTIEFYILLKEAGIAGKKPSIVISYNGSWQPLVIISLKPLNNSIFNRFLSWALKIINTIFKTR